MKKLRTVLVWILLVGALLVIVVASSSDDVDTYAPFDAFAMEAEQGLVREVQVDGSQLIVHSQTGSYRVLGTLDQGVLRDLSNAGAVVEWETGPDSLAMIAVGLVAVLVLGGLVMFQRRMQPNKQITDLRKTNARVVEKGSVETRFSDVGGLDQAKAELGDVIAFMTNPGPWEKAGATLPRGVLLEGPPGCGKTLLARAAAGEAGVGFMVVSGSEFVEMFVGVGATRMRDTFEAAQAAAPCILFIDEIDAIGRRRGSGSNLVNDEREQTLNQLLVSLDGFDAKSRVLVLAATNRADILDAALLRPGRFDLRLEVGTPNEQARASVLEIHMRDKPVAGDVDLGAIVALTDGCTGAELAQIANHASMTAVRRAIADKTEVRVTQGDLLTGVERRDRGVQGRRPLDVTVIESGAQFTVPLGASKVEITLRDGRIVEGTLIWADPNYLKVETDDGDLIIGKQHVQTLVSP